VADVPAPSGDRSELLKQKQQLEPLLEISPSAIVITDRDSNIVAWNPAAEELFGYSADEAVGQNLDDLVAKTEELHQAAVSYGERALEKDQVRTVTRRNRKDGTLVDVELRSAPLLSDGEVVGMFGIYHDVTEVTRQKRFYEALVDVSPAAIVAIDPDDRVTMWNPAAERLFGYPAEEAVGRLVDDLVANDDVLREEAAELNRTAEGGQIRLVTRRTRKDGSLVDVELLGAPVQVGKELVGRYAIYLDISELQRRKQYYEALLELSPTAVGTVSPEDIVTSWNPAAERLFGYSAEEAIGRNIDELVAGRKELHGEAVQVSKDITAEGVRLTTRRTRKDGSLVDVAVTAAPIFVGGELVGKYALYHDISELQEQKRFSESLLDLSPTAIVTVGNDNLVTRWNPAAERLFGYTAGEALGRDLDELVGRADHILDEAKAYTEEMAQGKQVHSIARRTRKDGSLVDVEMTGTPVFVHGERVGHLVIYHDISAIQRQKQFYQSVLELSPTAIITVDEEFNVTSWNPGAEQLFGYGADEAIGRFIDDLVANAPELRDDAAAYNEAGARGEPQRGFVRRTRKDGSLVDVEIVAAPVYVGEERVGHSVIYHDVGEIQRERRYYEALLEASPTAVIAIDTQNKVTTWNPAAERLFGYTADEAMGRDVDDLVANNEDVRAEAIDVGHRATREQVRLTARRTRKDGSLVDVDITAAPVFLGGELVGVYGLFNDISEIQEQKRYLEALLEVSPTAIVTVDRENRVTSWNPAAERTFGYTVQETLGKEIDELVAGSDDLRDEAARLTREGQTKLVRTGAVTHRTRKDGTFVDVQVAGVPVFVGGEWVGDLVIYHDVTELQRQRRYYESLLEMSPNAIMTVDLDATVTSWNPAAERLLGYSREEALGRNIDDLVAKRSDLRAEADEVSRRAYQGEQIHLVTRRTRKDGSLIDVDVVAAPIVVGGQQVAYYTMYSDITELQRQRRYYEELFQSNPVAVALLDLQGNVTSWNPQAEELFGYTEAEAVGRNIDDLVAANDEVRAEAQGMTARGMEGAVSHLITRRTRRDGSLADVEMFGSPVVVGGEVAGHYAMYHDIGPLEQARRDAEAATVAKSAFLATMSHEIRTPLNAVIGMTGLLLDTDLAPEQRSYGEVIRTSGDALLTVINEILDFSKIEAGRLDLERQPFRLRQCVESALELVATAATDKSLDLAYLIDPRTPTAIVGDFTRLRQILLNLLNNAVKFTNRGEVVLRVDATPAGPSPDGGPKRYEIHFSVRDTGIGIPEDRMDRLFEAFTQVDASTTRRYGGTGLGLAISKRLAEEMGGRMWVESRVGQGSTFHVTIHTEAAAGPLAAEELESIPEIAGKRVLIVDDNATNREILRRQAESWGMVPQEAATPNDALEYVRRGDPFDVAILDMQMPEMDGLALAEEIRRHRDPEALPLVMLTSLGYRDPSPSGGQFAAYMTKPIRPSQLYDALIGIFAPQMALQKVPPPSPRAATPSAERSPLRILLAEDNAVNQRVALLLLEKLGYRADVAADGREALQALERQPYDVVLMDVQMPEMDGLEATRRILERWPEPDRPRIVAMTAGATEADREACLAAGMNDYVSKPIRQEELAAALARSAPVSGGRAVEDAEGALIDPDELDQLRRTVGGQDALEEVMTTFLHDTDRILAELRSDAAAGRAAEVRRHAHSLKSTAASFGASALSDLCRRLEELGQAGRLEDAPALIEDVAAEFARVRTALRPGTGS
jgi:PAS domain S-box-containing protein